MAGEPTKQPKKLDTYARQSHDLVNSLLLVLPLLLIYELGILWTGGSTLNGVDFITVFLARTWGLDGILIFNGGLLLIGVGVVAWRWKNAQLNPKIIIPVVIESTVYALLLGTVIILFMKKIGLSAAGGYGVLERVFLSLGAGVNEELVFRLGLFSGLLYGLGKFLPKAPAVLGAVVISSVLFSAAHYLNPILDCAVCQKPVEQPQLERKKDAQPPPPHRSCQRCKRVFHQRCHAGLRKCPGPHGSSAKEAVPYYPPESFQVRTFVYRFLAGVIFCALFWWRGFAVAVYTHAIYDVWVLVILA